jgi:hypothetical protein
LRWGGATERNGSYPQFVLSNELDGARLRSLLAHLLVECDMRAHCEAAECAIEHAVSVKVDLVAIGGPQEAEFAGSVEALELCQVLANGLDAQCP